MPIRAEIRVTARGLKLMSKLASGNARARAQAMGWTEADVDERFAAAAARVV
jgi:hypothetical protein